jgi:regulator of sigma E protease
VSAFSGFILVLLGFGFLIFVHELGHFLAAKWAGIRADGFAIGMGPCVASYRRGIGFCFGSADTRAIRRFGKRPIEMSDAELNNGGLGETEYSLRMLPLGGYVRMLGQEDGNPAATSSDARSFGKATIPRRAVVILAGITANLVLAIALFLVAFLAGVRFPAPLVGFVAPNSPAAKATPVAGSETGTAPGLLPGDRVTASDGSEVKTFIDLRVAAAMAAPDTPIVLDIDRGGRSLRYSVLPERDGASGLLSIGVAPARSCALTDVRDSREEVARMLARIGVSRSSAAVGPGWRIESIDGKPVGTFAQLDDAARGSGGRPMQVAWRAPEDSPKGSNDSVVTEVAPKAEFPVLRTGGGKAADEALVGLSPLARVLEFAPGSANTSVLAEGDVFMRVGTLEGPRVSQLMAHFRANPSSEIAATVLRNGAPTDVTVRTDRDGRVGVYLEPAWDLPLIAQSIDAPDEGGPTAAAALAAIPLSTILAVDGTPIASLTALRAHLVARAATTDASAPLDIVVSLRDPSPQAAPHDARASISPSDVALLRSLSYGFPIPESYFDPEFTVLSANGNPVKAITMGFSQTVVMVEQVLLTIDRVFRGSVAANQLQGPVGIIHTGTKVADEGVMYIVFFMALISVNLAVVNLLPIPIADGGLFVFLMYERVTGRPPSIAFQNAAAMAGIALVAALFLFTFYNDIRRIFGG